MMTKKNNTIPRAFADCVIGQTTKIVDRAIAFLYYYAEVLDTGATAKQIQDDFGSVGLSRPNITNLRKALLKDRRVVKVRQDEWRLKGDKVVEVEQEFLLSKCLAHEPKKPVLVSSAYVNEGRFQELEARGKEEGCRFDFLRLLRMLAELDHAFSNGSYISVIFLVRAILDHIPPVFGMDTFIEVANNYSGTKSFKQSMLHLENSSRKIADSYLHTKIRDKESIPNKTQVNFSSDLDILLAEIVRIA